MGKKDLKSCLNSFSKPQLIRLIAELYDHNKSVREYLDFSLNSTEHDALQTYKKRVREAFYPAKGFGYNISYGKKAISDFRKLKPSPDLLIDLLLTYVESGVDFTNEFGDINEAFYSSIESVYYNAIKLIEKYNFQEAYKLRAKQILDETIDIGWGFHDTLSDMFYRVYGF